MSLDVITEEMRTRLVQNSDFDKVVKFDFGTQGVIRVDGTTTPASVTNEDTPAACTIKVSLDDFKDIASGKQNPQMAFMTGKLKVEGDMSVAFGLSKLLG